MSNTASTPLFACSRCFSRHPFEELSTGEQLCKVRNVTIIEFKIYRNIVYYFHWCSLLGTGITSVRHTYCYFDVTRLLCDISGMSRIIPSRQVHVLPFRVSTNKVSARCQGLRELRTMMKILSQITLIYHDFLPDSTNFVHIHHINQLT